MNGEDQVYLAGATSLTQEDTRSMGKRLDPPSADGENNPEFILHVIYHKSFSITTPSFYLIKRVTSIPFHINFYHFHFLQLSLTLLF